MAVIHIAPGERDPQRIVYVIRQLSEGRTDAILQGSLTANVGTTIFLAPNCSSTSQVFWTPRTANAAAEVGNGTMWLSAVAKGQFTITHANNAQTDRTFGFVCLG